MRSISPLGWVGLTWGVLGSELLLARPIVGLLGIVQDSLAGELRPVHFAFLALWLPFMAWSEGYRGFQQKLSPRIIARSFHLAQNPRFLHVLLAPLYAIALIHVRRSTLIARWILLTVIVGMIVSVRLLPAPWRGLVDAGVVVGLGWGALAILWYLVEAFRGRTPEVDLALPGSTRP